VLLVKRIDEGCPALRNMTGMVTIKCTTTWLTNYRSWWNRHFR